MEPNLNSIQKPTFQPPQKKLSVKAIVISLVAVLLVAGISSAYFLFIVNKNPRNGNIQQTQIPQSPTVEQVTPNFIQQGIIFSDKDGNVYQSELSGSTIKLTKFPHADGSVFVDEKGDNILWVDLADGMAEDYGVKNALLYNRINNSQKQIKELLDTKDQTTLGYVLSPSGKFLAYTRTSKQNSLIAENTSLVMLDLSSDQKTVLIKNFPPNLHLWGWSQDEKKLFLNDSENTSGNRHAWFVNDILLSLDIASRERSTLVDYKPICDKPSAISLVEGNENLFLAQCDLNTNHEKISVKLYDKGKNQVETLIEGNPFNEITGFYLSPDGNKLVYYSIVDKAFAFYNRETRQKEVLKNLETIQNQGIAFSPDSSKFIYSIKKDVSSPGIFIYDFGAKSVTTLQEKGSFLSWIKE